MRWRTDFTPPGTTPDFETKLLVGDLREISDLQLNFVISAYYCIWLPLVSFAPAENYSTPRVPGAKKPGSSLSDGSPFNMLDRLCG